MNLAHASRRRQLRSPSFGLASRWIFVLLWLAAALGVGRILAATDDDPANPTAMHFAEQVRPFLDRTMLFFGSNLGAGSTHSTKNLPILLAGGGFQHGQHLVFHPDDPPPPCNLYVSMLQQLGIQADTFGSSTGTPAGLEPRA